MYNKTVIEPTEKYEDGLEKVTHDYYVNRKREKLGYIGPTVRGIDVGAARYADLNLDYPTYDITTEKVTYKDFDFGGYRVRWFRPESVEGKAAAIFYIHGGGYLTGTIERYNHMNSRLAELIHGNVFHVDYTLSPETGFPTALHQCYHSIEWVVKNCDEYLTDPDKIAIMGDSAGGNACAVLPLMDRENRYIKMNILYYPAVDMTQESAKKFDLSKFGTNLTPFVEARVKALMGGGGMNEIYLQNNEDPYDELISPIFAKDLTGYPRTLCFTAEFDFLTLQSEDFCDKLAEAGIDVDYYKFNGTFHGYLDRVGYFESSEKSMELVAKHVREEFGY